MPIRMSGLISNLDTDSIIKELMKAQSTKKTKIQNKITKTEWTQEKWKELNTKIYSLYTGSISKLKTQGSYSTKKATSSNESKVTVSASVNAVNGSHSVQVNKLASAQYLTGNKVTAKDGTAVKGTTTLAAIDETLKGTVINFSTQDKSYSLTVTDKTTVNDFVNAAKEAGITASFDTNQNRFFLSSSNSGIENAFSITTSTIAADELAVKDSIRQQVKYDDLSSSDQAILDNAIDKYKELSKRLTDTSLTESDKKALQTQIDSYQDTINSYVEKKVTADLKAAYLAGNVSESDTIDYGVRSVADVTQEATDKYNESLGDKEFKQEDLDKAIKSALETEANKYTTAVKKEFTDTAPTNNAYTQAAVAMGGALSSILSTSDATQDTITTGVASKLDGLGLTSVKAEIAADGQSITYTKANSSISMTEASNSEIVYNGATLTSTTNTITANGLTFDVHGVTAAGETITLTVSKDTQAVYDTIKQFVKDYNEVLKEMNTLYNAESSKGYDPLTDEEKEAMSEDQIEKWEKKIKDSLLRRDGTLSSIISSMKNSMMGSVSYNGKSYALSTFGIGTTDYTEKGLLHIDGDIDDSSTSIKDDKLMKALEEDPEAVMTTLSTLAGNLYADFADKMKSTSLSSALTFYNDKELSSNVKTYKSDLSKMEDRLKSLEDRYYKQFSAMEVAMSKLNSQTSALSSFMGTNY